MNGSEKLDDKKPDEGAITIDPASADIQVQVGPDGAWFDIRERRRSGKIPYVLGAAAVGAIEFIFLAFLAPLLAPSNSFLKPRSPEGGLSILWFLFILYLAGAFGAVGGLRALVVAARLDPRQSWGLPLARGIIATLAPLPVLALIVLLARRLSRYWYSDVPFYPTMEIAVALVLAFILAVIPVSVLAGYVGASLCSWFGQTDLKAAALAAGHGVTGGWTLDVLRQWWKAGSDK